MKTFFIWWLLTLVLGAGFMPLTGLLFGQFKDRGWLFSKVLGVGISGFLTWAVVGTGIVSFSMPVCIIVTVICLLGNLLVWHLSRKKGRTLIIGQDQLRLIIIEEFLFFIVFLIWTYLAGFRPEAYGTEKFMDYGFMAAMMRSDTLPAQDLWHAGSEINYYYGGQYYAVFLTKLTNTRIEETYNVMRMLVAAFAFTLPFSLVSQMWMDRTKHIDDQKTKMQMLPGLTAGAAVSLCGNMHYVIIGKLQPLINKLMGRSNDDYSYWFPNSTRYIGHYPEAGDRTIHEFPCYSFVLGDLHAHVVNVMFVLTVLGILYAWIRSTSDTGETEISLKRMLEPHLLALAFLIGIFQWTNYWDFLIYFVVTGAVILYRNIRRYSGKKIIIATALQAVTLFLIAYAAALPFTLQFQNMVSGVALAKNHSIFYQLAILWGMPAVLSLLFIAGIFMNYRKEKMPQAGGKLQRFFQAVLKADLFVVILCLCSLGLILIPELVYVRDIYEENSARANTMFKLTYQAYIMFGISMAYILFRFLGSIRKKVRIAGIAGMICLLGTLGYFANAVNGWFGDVLDTSRYQGLDATAFLEEDFPDDAAAIRWLNENITDSPVVLEANGDSYSDYERVSAMTGLPTVLGWYVHEWLWRGDTAELNQRAADIELIYTSADPEAVEEQIEKYKISYIFVGAREREKYEALNNEMLRELGEIVFESEGTYIVAISS